VFLREAFGERTAFVYGWMSLLVMDPGLTAALAVGLAQYVLALLGGPASLVPVVAIVSIILLSIVSILGVENSARVMRWTAAAKLGVVVVLVAAVLVRSGAAPTTASAAAAALPSFQVLGGALMGAFFAFGGWWDLGKMSEEIVDPKRTLPVALVGGIVVVTVVYAGLSVAFLRVRGGAAPANNTGEIKAMLRGELKQLDAELAGAQKRATDLATKRHLDDARQQISHILKPAAAASAGEAADEEGIRIRY